MASPSISPIWVSLPLIGATVCAECRQNGAAKGDKSICVLSLSGGFLLRVVKARGFGVSPSVPCWAASIASPMRSCILLWAAEGAQGQPNTNGSSRGGVRGKQRAGGLGRPQARCILSILFPAFNGVGGVRTCCLCWGAKTPYHPASFLFAALSATFTGPALSAHTFPPCSNKQEDPLVLSALDSRPNAKGRESGAG
jgi:hypothetical protein